VITSYTYFPYGMFAVTGAVKESVIIPLFALVIDVVRLNATFAVVYDFLALDVTVKPVRLYGFP
jgi:hypothetical protein